ncbi:LCP family protein [Paenibacillus oceani]|uniref:LCP family protein n=1 Tax=Paenibacillus oceani TaxID=2772510 RepID=A0A927C467_9BACL|nr:LCP family protein [Paenibacillus oceani]MBD2860499.1 LCP family protein [Paenibacillus oceani]
MGEKQPNRLRKKIVIATVSVLGVLVGGVAVYTGYLYNKADTALNRMAAAQPAKPGQPAGGETTGQPMKPISFLLAGVDNREGGGGSMNTDALMLVALNPETKDATVVSLPRDMRLKPKQISSQKANYYYAYHYNKDKEAAIPNTKQFFSELFNIPIDYMAVIHFDGFRKLVDTLGGLNIDVDMDMRYVDTEDGTDINLKKGRQILDGKETLDFVRYRKSNQGTAESSDLARNERQHQVLGQLLDKLTSFNGIAQWGSVLDIAGESVKTDIPVSLLREWILQYGKLKPDRLEFVPLEGRWDSPYIVPTEEDVKTALTAFRSRLGLPADDSLKIANVIGVDSPEPNTVTKDTYRR